MVVELKQESYKPLENVKINGKDIRELSTQELSEVMVGYMEVGDVRMIRESFDYLKSLDNNSTRKVLIPIYHALGFELGYTEKEILESYLDN